MKKLIYLVSLLFAFTAISTKVTGQQSNALLKVVKDDNGVRVYDMQGNEIKPSPSIVQESNNQKLQVKEKKTGFGLRE